MKVTAALKQYAIEQLKCAADASDEVIKKAVSDAILAGTLEPAKLAELSTVKATEAQNMVKSMIDEANAPILKALETLTAKMAGTPGQSAAPPVAPPAGTGEASPAQKMYAAAAGAATPGGDGGSTTDGYDRVRVKSVVEQFSDTRTAATWDKSTNPHLAKAFAGRPIDSHISEGLPYSVDMPSERQKAIAGAWFKHLALKSMKGNVPSHLRMREIDLQLVQHAIHECKFMGEVGGYEYEGDRLVDPMHYKALLDDSTSGGLEAVPIEFDSAFILTPLLNGEVFPLVDQRVVSRRRIEATKIDNPTISWGTSEGTEIPLFDTDGFISAFDNTIYPITGAMELGLDFLADSPLAIGNIVVGRYGEVFRKEMDTVLCTGNGTNRPEGVFNASGVSTVTMSNAAPTVGGYEGLIFGVGKEYLAQAGNPPNSRATFVGTQTSYSRARAIPVDSSNDARRIFGMDELSYTLFGFKYAINASPGNTKIGFVCWNRYRLYRRLGFQVAVVTQDWGLARANKQGIIVRGRFGGSLEDAAAMTKSIDAQA